MSTDDPALVAVGRIGKAHGLRGEVSVQAWTDDPEDRFSPGSVLRTDSRPDGAATEPGPGGPTLTVETARVHAGRWLLGFAGVADRTAAEALRGTRLLLPATARPAIEDPDEFYDSDLVGLRAETPAGAVLGTVTDVVHGPVGDYLVIVLSGPPIAAPHQVSGTPREHLVPFVAQLVPRVDPPAGVVVIDAPDGLFDL